MSGKSLLVNRRELPIHLTCLNRVDTENVYVYNTIVAAQSVLIDLPL